MPEKKKRQQAANHYLPFIVRWLLIALAREGIRELVEWLAG